MRHSKLRERGLSSLLSVFPIPVRSSILATLVVLSVLTAQSAAGASGPERWIVFSALPPGGLPPQQLFRITTDGTGIEQITKGNKPATDPAFSPDGKRIVFVRLGAGVYVMNLDGSGERRLTSGPHDLLPVWSPDAKHIAFIRLRKNQWRLFEMTPAGKKLRRLPLASPAGRPSWTADSKSIFIPAVGALERIDARTGRVQRHIVMREDVTQTATVSPNSKMVAFRAPRPSIPGCGAVSCLVFAVYLGDVRSGKLRRFVNDTGPPGWSRDSKTLVFVYRGGLALWPVAGDSPTMLAIGSHVAQADAPPAWQPR
jgi:Tol biopolymer transport system component